MTALLDAPAEVPASAPRRPSAASRLLLAGLVIGALLLLGLAGFRAAQASTRLGPVTPVFGGSAPAVTLPTYGLNGTYVIGYEHGASARISLPLSNPGLLPVTVSSLDLGGGVAPLLEVQDVRGLPVTLGPGESAVVEVQAQLANCRFFHEREVQHYAGVRLGLEVLGQETTRQVAFDRPLMVHSPMIVGCPERKINREENDRSDLSANG